MICKHASSGCNYPESECAGLCTVIRDARVKAGLSVEQAAVMCHAHVRTWQRWESGDSVMPGAAWELFNLRTLPAVLKKQAT